MKINTINGSFFNQKFIKKLHKKIPNKINKEFDLEFYGDNVWGWARFDNSKFNCIYYYTKDKKLNRRIIIKFDYENGYKFNSIYLLPELGNIKEYRYDGDMNLVCINLHNPMFKEDLLKGVSGKFEVSKKTIDNKIVDTHYVFLNNGKRDTKSFKKEIDYLKKNSIIEFEYNQNKFNYLTKRNDIYYIYIG